MRISLIITAYNNAATLSRTLESVLAQIQPFAEVIIIDDGSQDQTREVVESYQNKIKKLQYIFQENQGVAAARNHGMRFSTSEFICFLDGDDTLHPSMAISLVETMNATDGRYDAYHYNFFQQFPNGKWQENRYFLHKKLMYAGEEFLNQSLQTFSFEAKHMVWSFCFKKTTLEKLNMRFVETLHVFEDIVFLQSLFAGHIQIYILNQPLVYYHFQQGSLTNKNNLNEQAFINVYQAIHCPSINQEQYFLALAVKVYNRYDSIKMFADACGLNFNKFLFFYLKAKFIFGKILRKIGVKK